MNKQLLLTIASILLACQMTAVASNSVSAGARYHMRHSEYLELPFDKGDISYLLGYEYHEANAFWQLLLGYTPEISEGDDGRGAGIDYAITPQINLFFEDRNWLGGIGALASYVEAENSEFSDWTDVYWQLMLGFQIPLPALDFEVMAYYPFEKWSTLDQFDAGDIEYGLLIKFKF